MTRIDAGRTHQPRVRFDLRTYTILELYSSGLRFCDDYDEAAAVEQFLELHPDAQRCDVERELQAEIKRCGG